VLRLSDVSKHYGSRAVLDETSLTVTPGEKIALVGANGAGKTTLLRIVCGEEELDAGTVHLATGWVVGYLPQDAGVVDERTLWDEMLVAHSDLRALQQEIAATEDRLRGNLSDDELGALVDHQAELNVRFEARGGYRLESEIHKVLAGLGFREDDLHKRTDQFSGGWRTRIALAKLLVRSPDLLLFDEPTNHLDIDATEWLETYLKASGASAIVVSHDRYFLDRCISRTVELEAGKLTDFAGSYSYFVAEKARRSSSQQNAYDRQQRELKRQQVFIDRFRAKSSKATQVKSREKMLAKIERVDAPETHTRSMALKFPPAKPSHREVIVAQGIVKSYGSRHVFDGLALALERGERLALVGPNGAGKSTLLRMLAEVEKPDRGTLLHGGGVRVGYYAQDQTEVLDVSRTVLEEAYSAAPAGWGETDVRSLLGRFCFTGDDAQKRIGVLSGGEKARLAIARLLLQPANLLLLDEPTNHLDLASREELERALKAFGGTVVMASHDRYFMDTVATKIGEVGDGRMRVYLGNYTTYRDRRVVAGGSNTSTRGMLNGAVLRNAAASLEAAVPGQSAEPAPDAVAAPTNGAVPTPANGTGSTHPAAVDPTPAPTPSDGNDRRERGNDRRRRGPSAQEKELAKVESELGRLTARRTEVEAMLADPAHYGEPGALEALAAEHAALGDQARHLEARWEALAEEPVPSA